MPIYEFACPKCRVIFNFLSKRINPDRIPACPKCGNKKLTKQMSRFAMPKGVKEPAQAPADMGGEGGPPMPDLDDPKIMKVMGDLEKSMDSLDENNPKHVAYMMKKMKEIMPEGTMPKEMDVAIRRLEKGDDPEKVEADMGPEFDQMFGGEEGGIPRVGRGEFRELTRRRSFGAMARRGVEG